MIRVMVLYPKAGADEFNLDYWKTTHMALCESSWPKLVKWEADSCAADSDYHGVAHLYFESVEDFQSSMGSPEAAAVMGDMPNYYAAGPVLLVNEIVSTSA